MLKNRIKIVSLIFILMFCLISVRLFYWQIWSNSKLQAIAQTQHQTTIEIPASRGKILASDGFPLVNNQPAYLVFAYIPDIEPNQEFQIAEKIAPIIAPIPEENSATPSAIQKIELEKKTKNEILDKLTNHTGSWVALNKRINSEQKQQVENLKFKGIGFEEYQIRQYPEASMAAQLIGFVGSDGQGKPKGYFGLEGFYNLELTGKSTIINQEKDAFGRPIMIGDYQKTLGRDGRDLVTYIDRRIQNLIETELEKGIQKYEAKSGEVVIMDPITNGIIAMAALPSFNPIDYKKYDPNSWNVPSISQTYEPGSTFKIITVAAGIDDGKITPETTCNDPCSGPVEISKYQIRTWDDKYYPGETILEALERSDNTAMIYIANKLGIDTFTKYIKNFGIGEATNIDLESETIPQLRSDWKEIDLATASFGQGIAINSIQMLRAVSVIANQGKLYQPFVVKEVIFGDQKMEVKPKFIRQVIKPETAITMTQMMIKSADHGDAKWTIPKGYKIAGKTGTAQIAIKGHYDEEKTMASFVGFAPADKPRFVMLVKLREPQSSQWASETAAPLWFNIAKELFNYLNIPPDTL